QVLNRSDQAIVYFCIIFRSLARSWRHYNVKGSGVNLAAHLIDDWRCVIERVTRLAIAHVPPVRLPLTVTLVHEQHGLARTLTLVLIVRLDGLEHRDNVIGILEVAVIDWISFRHYRQPWKLMGLRLTMLGSL